MLGFSKCTLFIHPMESSGLGPCLRRDSRSRISYVLCPTVSQPSTSTCFCCSFTQPHVALQTPEVRSFRNFSSFLNLSIPTMSSPTFRQGPTVLVPNPSRRLRTVLNLQIFPFAVLIETFSQITSLQFTPTEDISASINDSIELAWPNDLPDAPEFQDADETSGSLNETKSETRNC